MANTPEPENNREDILQPSEVIEIWKQVVSVQMHFNDICMKIRSLAITAVAAILAASGFASREVVQYPILCWEVSSVSLIIFIAAILWISFYYVDRFWYHQLLLGAVNHGKQIEGKHKDDIGELHLANSIAAKIPTNVSCRRITAFYVLVFIVLILALFISL